MIAEDVDHPDLILFALIDCKIDIEDRLALAQTRLKLHIGIDVALLSIEIFDRLGRLADLVGGEYFSVADDSAVLFLRRYR